MLAESSFALFSVRVRVLVGASFGDSSAATSSLARLESNACAARRRESRRRGDERLSNRTAARVHCETESFRGVLLMNLNLLPPKRSKSSSAICDARGLLALRTRTPTRARKTQQKSAVSSHGRRSSSLAPGVRGAKGAYPYLTYTVTGFSNMSFC